MIGMVMREGNRVDPPHPFAEQLNPHFGRRVDEQITSRESQQHAGPGPLVARIARVANRAVTPQDRDARGRSGAQKNQPTRRGSRALDQPNQPPRCIDRDQAGSISGCLRGRAHNGMSLFYEIQGRTATRPEFNGRAESEKMAIDSVATKVPCFVIRIARRANG